MLEETQGGEKEVSGTCLLLTETMDQVCMSSFGGKGLTEEH